MHWVLFLKVLNSPISYKECFAIDFMIVTYTACVSEYFIILCGSIIDITISITKHNAFKIHCLPTVYG